MRRCLALVTEAGDIPRMTADSEVVKPRRTRQAIRIFPGVRPEEARDLHQPSKALTTNEMTLFQGSAVLSGLSKDFLGLLRGVPHKRFCLTELVRQIIDIAGNRN